MRRLEYPLRLSSLLLVRHVAERETPPRPLLPKPELETTGLIVEGVNPRRQRKGKSGELPRHRG